MEQTTLLENLLNKEQKDFLSLSQLKTKLNAAAKKAFALSAKSNGKEIENAVRPFLGNNLALLKGGRSVYLARNLPPETIIFNVLQEKSAKKPVAPRFVSVPFNKETIAEIYNDLLRQNRIIVTLNKEFKVSGISVRDERLPHTEEVVPKITNKAPATDSELFQAAFNKLRQGKTSVRICRLRYELQWTKERFDNCLTELRRSYRIQLLDGSPADLTPQERADSFTDNENRFYAAVQWIQ
jgi:hypothetical protein